MPSPFPGMDPFIEMQEWDDFHGRFVADIAEALDSQVGPDYFVRCQRRVYVEHDPQDRPRQIVPDTSLVVEAAKRPSSHAARPMSKAGVACPPVEIELPMPVERRELYLTIRERVTLDVVTVLELLSPSNKRSRGPGRRKYLAKREAVLQSQSHLVELDFIRGGRHLPAREPFPQGDYFAIVSRAQRRPKAEVYAWTLRDPLPPIPIPVAEGDADLVLDLQSLLNHRYDHSRYYKSIDYTAPLTPPVSDADAAWMAEIINRRMNPHD